LSMTAQYSGLGTGTWVRTMGPTFIYVLKWCGHNKNIW
jgi:hypothetical protein